MFTDKRTNRFKVAIVIPIYKNELSCYEEISLHRVFKILDKFDKFFVIPESLKVDYTCICNNVRTIRFSDKCFENVYTYSQLMLSVDFYKSFTCYEYILIYQLDAFVFSDRLSYFCSLGYDYIGAPVKSYSENWIDIGNNIGNGGFSLRRVSSCIKVVQKKEEIFKRMPSKWEINRFLDSEDVFFSFCGTFDDLDFKVPGFLIAISFSVGCDTGHAFKKMPAWLPFGCHAWNKIDYCYWKPILEGLGYALPDASGIQTNSSRRILCIEYLFKRTSRLINVNNFYKKLVSEIFQEKSYVLWGYGSFGKILYEILIKANKRVMRVYDAGNLPISLDDGNKIQKPDIKQIKNDGVKVIVSTIRRESEIKEFFHKSFLEEGRHYICFSQYGEDFWNKFWQFWGERGA